ncbi:MAG: DUF296 domain-containing protein [Rhizobiales bacterium]|nr:DUF296 domain-containing protein [Hyphomicrobiales bacterium]
MSFEKGQFGRVIFARLRPDEDLVLGIEALCREAGFIHAVVRGSLGSLNQATLGIGPRVIKLPDYGLEITALYGEVRAGTAFLSGSLVDQAGTVFSGRFISGGNAISVTAEITLEEWEAD